MTAWLTPRYKQAKTKLSEASGLLWIWGGPPDSRRDDRPGGKQQHGSTAGLRATWRGTIRLPAAAKAEGASTNMTLREARPLATRYLLVTLTSLPKTTGKKYQGGISSIQVRG